MNRSPRRTVLRAATVLAVAAATVLVAATPALAHVTAQAGDAKKGGYAVVTFRVPNESDTAGTVGLTVTLPTDKPLTSVRTTPIAGWTATTKQVALNPPVQSGGRTITQTIGSITWTANPGTRIGPGQYLDFPVSVGPMPTDTDSISLPASQTYDDGKVVDWNQPAVAGGAEPAHPAPVVKLTAADAAGGHGGMATTSTPPAADATDMTARWLGIGGLLVGAVGLALGGGAILRSRRSTAGGRTEQPAEPEKVG
ncbi:YcnI family protein [Pseudonocardia sp. GCM10023141]|uniref:YcnI family copper-binding membrane protein n=1 Tax=Pseudonocardia sp. GCM10023141 TaxID=3252653 RepID=UPI003612D8D2